MLAVAFDDVVAAAVLTYFERITPFGLTVDAYDIVVLIVRCESIKQIGSVFEVDDGGHGSSPVVVVMFRVWVIKYALLSAGLSHRVFPDLCCDGWT